MKPAERSPRLVTVGMVALGIASCSASLSLPGTGVGGGRWASTGTGGAPGMGAITGVSAGAPGTGASPGAGGLGGASVLPPFGGTTGAGGSGGAGGVRASAGQIVEFRDWTSEAVPYNITTGPDGNLWMTDLSVTNYLTFITPGGLVSYLGMSSDQELPTGLVAHRGRRDDYRIPASRD